jgi:hypothetical protein
MLVRLKIDIEGLGKARERVSVGPAMAKRLCYRKQATPIAAPPKTKRK